jgi:methylenetetrahydrofolate dehydrogenase (NADP+) / methenyltetrahydrofolate cyclohydrolase
MIKSFDFNGLFSSDHGPVDSKLQSAASAGHENEDGNGDGHRSGNGHGNGDGLDELIAKNRPKPETEITGDSGPRILWGAPVAKQLYDWCRHWHDLYLARVGRPVGLGVVRVGDDPASQVYIGHKRASAEALGFAFFQHVFSGQEAPSVIESHVAAWCHPRSPVNGVIVQLPVPDGHDKFSYLGAVQPNWDVDGLHPRVRSPFVPCTPLGCLALLRAYRIPVAGKHCVIVGRSPLVGRPLAELLLTADATVTVAHSKTIDLAQITRQGAIVIAAAGKRHLLTPEYFQSGAIVLDVGIHRQDKPIDGGKQLDALSDDSVAQPDGRASVKVAAGTSGALSGDVDPQSYQDLGAYSPVPGGIGPTTVACLMVNTLVAAYRQHGFDLQLPDLIASAYPCRGG